MEDWKQKFVLPLRFKQERSIRWEERIPSNINENHVDLWRGCPDYLPSHEFVTAIREVITNGNVALHQYAKGSGHPRLVVVLAKLYSHLLQRDVNPLDHILVCFDIYGLMTNAILSNVTNGDEVIIVQPSSDLYEYIVRMAGGISKFVPLRLKQNITTPSSSSDWKLDDLELEKVFNSKTKLIILSTPNCHVGKVYTIDELEKICSLCKKWNVVCVSDESEEFLVYKPQQFTRIASLPEMWERTITIGSFDNTFFLKGWKIAWAYGPCNLIKNLETVHFNAVLTCPTPLQEAIACVFEKKLENMDKNKMVFADTINSLTLKKQSMFDTLREVGLNPVKSESGIFIIADVSSLEMSINYGENNNFVEWLAKKAHIQVVPLCIFYHEEYKSNFKHLVRFCFNRKKDTLRLARDLLQECFKGH